MIPQSLFLSVFFSFAIKINTNKYSSVSHDLFYFIYYFKNNIKNFLFERSRFPLCLCSCMHLFPVLSRSYYTFVNVVSHASIVIMYVVVCLLCQYLVHPLLEYASIPVGLFRLCALD